MCRVVLREVVMAFHNMERNIISMKKLKFSFLSILFLAFTPAFASVGHEDLQEARELAEKGKYEEALQKHLWFHEESKKTTGMGGFDFHSLWLSGCVWRRNIQRRWRHLSKSGTFMKAI
jgi:hypothetical protein